MTQTWNEEALFKKTPQELTLLLYKALENNMKSAIAHIETKKYDVANKLLQKCNDILERLGAGINYEAGIIADQLEAVYQYLAEQTILANIRKDTQILRHNLEVLKNISEAWQTVLETGQSKVSHQLTKRMAYENVYETVLVDTKE